ncbi:MAG: hypothetical protein JNJ59_06110 [Deltaproteobacteria bacterium]|nr:hypothetical protein [Deltaproteobacteria bacterium]
MTAFSLDPPAERRRLVVVDAHGHAFRAFHALGSMQAPDGRPVQAIYGLAGLLKRLVVDERWDYIAVVFDAPDDQRRTFRTGLYADYKAHRPERPVDLAIQIPVLRDATRAMGLACLEHPDFEADDCIATIVAQAEAAAVETTILSADKDLFQLVSQRTTVWDAMRGKRYDTAGVVEKLGVPPHLVADYLALVGDASDNVPGVPGIGPKGACTLLGTLGSLDAVYAALDTLPPREQKRLAEHRERAYLSRELTRLRADVPLAARLPDLTPPPPHAIDTSLWSELGFDSLLRSLPPHLKRQDGARPRPAAPLTPPAPNPTAESPFIPAPPAAVTAPAALAPATESPLIPAPAARPAAPPAPAPRKPAQLAFSFLDYERPPGPT